MSFVSDTAGSAVYCSYTTLTDMIVILSITDFLSESVNLEINVSSGNCRVHMSLCSPSKRRQVPPLLQWLFKACNAMPGACFVL